jgi:hypothetical protein
VFFQSLFKELCYARRNLYYRLLQNLNIAPEGQPKFHENEYKNIHEVNEILDHDL